MRARIFAWLLVIVLWPSATETVELVGHWVRFGDAAHAAGDRHASPPFDDDDSRGCNEHGCTPMFHVCGCHGTPMNASALAVEIPRTIAFQRAAIASPLALESHPANAPLLRPPIS